MPILARKDELTIEREELIGFGKIFADIEWLLTILVLLYLRIPGVDVGSDTAILIAAVAFALLVLVFHYVGLQRTHTRYKLAIETLAMILFITVVVWQTGALHSQLFGLYYLVVVAAANAMGRRVALGTAGAVSAVALAFFLSVDSVAPVGRSHAGALVFQLVPLWLVVYLASMLSHQTTSAKRRIKALSQTDQLTGLWNMRSFAARVERALEASESAVQACALMVVDADNLKPVNDTFGHEAGNDLIRLVAEILRGCTRPADVVARFGGDEFVVYVDGCDRETALGIAERIRSTIKDAGLDVNGERVCVTVSIGLALGSSGGRGVEELMKLADEAMYRSKQEGRDRVTLAGSTPPVLAQDRVIER